MPLSYSLKKLCLFYWKIMSITDVAAKWGKDSFSNLRPVFPTAFPEQENAQDNHG
jgi:hypothetical protein